MGDKAPNKAERELVRKKNQAARDEFDMENLGDYKLVYPIKNDAVSISFLNY